MLCYFFTRAHKVNVLAAIPQWHSLTLIVGEQWNASDTGDMTRPQTVTPVSRGCPPMNAKSFIINTY